jgi:hypothetical protein
MVTTTTVLEVLRMAAARTTGPLMDRTVSG